MEDGRESGQRPPVKYTVRFGDQMVAGESPFLLLIGDSRAEGQPGSKPAAVMIGSSIEMCAALEHAVAALITSLRRGRVPEETIEQVINMAVGAGKNRSLYAEIMADIPLGGTSERSTP